MTKYVIEKATQRFKKYKATLDTGEVIYFGDSRYGQYKDTTGLGLYSHKDHLDKKRKQSYYARHGKKAIPYSAKWFSHRYLWS